MRWQTRWQMRWQKEVPWRQDLCHRVHITCAGTVLWGAMTAAIGASRTLPEAPARLAAPASPLSPWLGLPDAQACQCPSWLWLWPNSSTCTLCTLQLPSALMH